MSILSNDWEVRRQQTLERYAEYQRIADRILGGDVVYPIPDTEEFSKVLAAQAKRVSDANAHAQDALAFVRVLRQVFGK